MENNDIIFQQALDNVEESIQLALREMEIPDSIDLDAIERSESTLDAWDYCYSIAIGLAGIFIATDEAFAEYLTKIHEAASGNNGDFDKFQSFLGHALHHEGDAIDTIKAPFKNRNGGNAYGLFHRLLWGHDIFSIGEDNPFVLMYKQQGLSGIIQAVQHLLADTTSKQGLPLPFSSFFDITDEDDPKKVSNYLIKLAQQLSEESTGKMGNAQEIYSHMMTIRAQDVTAGVVVKSVSELYFKLRGIADDMRCTEIRLIAYTVNFLGEAVVGATRQNCVPYINTPLAIAMGTEFARFCYLNGKDSRKVSQNTDVLHMQAEMLQKGQARLEGIIPEYADADSIIMAADVAEENVEELLSFFSEGLV